MAGADAAGRVPLIATLLPDPGDPEERRRLIERIGGRVVPKVEKKNVAGNRVEVEREETVGGILHWGRESSHDLQFFRDEIRKAYGGRAPRVLDPFAGGGAIPLEAVSILPMLCRWLRQVLNAPFATFDRALGRPDRESES
jgi:putative DNA methylase